MKREQKALLLYKLRRRQRYYYDVKQLLRDRCMSILHIQKNDMT